MGSVSAALLVREARERAGLSQRTLASRCKTSQPAIARYESGLTVPRTDTLERLLAACGEELGSLPGGGPSSTDVESKGPKGRLLRRLRSRVLEEMTAVGVSNPRVFGSVARGEDTADSDIDILVDLGRDGDVLACYELAERLRPLLGSVDVTTPALLREDVRQRAFAEARAL